MEALEMNEFVPSFVDGYGSGSGSGDGSGSGSGFGSGSGSGFGSGFGYGYLFGVKLNGQTIHNIDNVATIITKVRKNVAKGLIVNDDMTTHPCYVIKQNDIFAHGKTLREANIALLDKIFDNMPVEEKIEEFVKKFELDVKYSNELFFDWHNKLTGSCEMGRLSFAQNKGIDLNDEMTVQNFILLTENDYGGNIIKQLKRKLQNTEDGI